VIVAQVLQLALVAKSPTPRYLVPAIGLASLNVCLPCLLGGAISKRWPRRAMGAAVAIALGTGALDQTGRAARLIRCLEDRKVKQLQVYEFAQGLKDTHIVLLRGAPSPVYALELGNQRAGLRYTRDLRAMFPDAVFYQFRFVLDRPTAGWPPVEGKGYFRFGSEPVQSERISAWAHEGHLVFDGTRAWLPTTFDYEVPPGWPVPAPLDARVSCSGQFPAEVVKVWGGGTGLFRARPLPARIPEDLLRGPQAPAVGGGR
jgi:hypothetical protein